MALQQHSLAPQTFADAGPFASSLEDERRWATRKSCATAGIIMTPALAIPVPCIIRDMSTTGARLEIREAGAVAGSKLKLPSTFMLVIRTDRFEVDCAIQWRRGGEIGVRFLAAPRPVARVVRPTA